MRVAIVMPLADQRGGAELLLLHLLRYRSEAGTEWAVIFLESGPLCDVVRDLGVEVYECDAGRLRNVLSWWQTVRMIRRVVQNGRFGAILAWMPKAQLYTGVAGRLAGVPVVWYQHGMPKRKDWMDWLMIKLPARGIIACSGAAAEAQRKLRPLRPMRVVYPCFDPAVFGKNGVVPVHQVRAKLGLPADRPIIGLIGRLQRWKGVHTLLQAMPAVLDQHPDALCVVVGGEHELEPDYAGYLDEMIASLNLGESVRMVGFQGNVPEWMSAMDVVVHASDGEPFGMVIIEAMSLGKPVIAGASGGPLEILRDREEGLLVQFEDVEGMAEAVKYYLNNPDEAETIAARGRERMRSFTCARFAKEISAAIEELAG